MKKKTIYDIKIGAIEKRFDKLRETIDNELREFIKQKVLALKKDCERTQHSMYCLNDSVEDKDFERLQDFIYKLGDDFGVDFYFTCENGEFTYYH